MKEGEGMKKGKGSNAWHNEQKHGKEDPKYKYKHKPQNVNLKTSNKAAMFYMSETSKTERLKNLTCTNGN